MGNYCFFIAASWGDAVIPKYFKTLAHHLVERGHRVVYTPHGKKINVDEGRLHVRSFPSSRPTRIRDFIFLQKLVYKYQPDCMIANFGAVNVMNIVGWLNRIPCRVDWYHTISTANILDSNSSAWRHAILNSRKKLVYSLATHIIGNSEAARIDAINAFSVAWSKTHVLYNVMQDLKDPISLSSRSSEVVICPGRLDPTKGQDVVIKAIALLKQQNLKPIVRFVGTGRCLYEYQRLAQELGLSDQCVFAGAVPHRQMLREMETAAFTIVPSRSEAFGLVNIESMSVGTPVIASAVGGIPEIIRDGIDGFLVPADNPEALAEKINILYSDPSLRDQMGRNARQRFLDKFELTKNIAHQAEWFEDLVRTRKNF